MEKRGREERRDQGRDVRKGCEINDERRGKEKGEPMRGRRRGR